MYNLLVSNIDLLHLKICRIQFDCEIGDGPTSTIRRHKIQRVAGAHCDCEIETVYNMTDVQCRILRRGPDLYFSRNGTYVNESLRSHTIASGGDSAAPKPAQCDPKKGVLAFAVGNNLDP